MKRDDAYYKAMLARDARFDGKFFVGVKTTGIYCRPICPAKPKRQNVEFFANHLEAERAGYRPCLRCRPESAPMSPAWIGSSALVQRAVRKLQHQESVLDLDENRFAEFFGITARHLRRLFMEEIGKTPKQLAFENRLNLARQLVVETSMPFGQIAFAAGFKSIRRFNDAFQLRFKKNPKSLRRKPTGKKEGLRLTLAYRPPFDFDSLWRFYKSHRVGLLETFEEGRMIRIVQLGGKIGRIVIGNDAERSRLAVEIDFPDAAQIPAILGRVRSMFDLDSDPVLIANSLEKNPKLKVLMKKYPGVRLFSGWDPFEASISAILGQLVSVDRARALVSEVVQRLGDETDLEQDGQRIRLFPRPDQIAASDLAWLGTTGARKRTLVAFSKAVAEGKISLDPTQDVESFSVKIRELPGIGPWTANVIALKVLRHTDAFPETDLILARVLEMYPKEEIESLRPWRGYAAALFWREYAIQLQKKKRGKK